MLITDLTFPPTDPYLTLTPVGQDLNLNMNVIIPSVSLRDSRIHLTKKQKQTNKQTNVLFQKQMLGFSYNLTKF